jgi:hypothetical protein
MVFGTISFLTALPVVFFVRDTPDDKGAKPAGPEAVKGTVG